MKKKEINYTLRGVKLNLERSYKTTKKLKFGSIIILDDILWKVFGLEN